MRALLALLVAALPTLARAQATLNPRYNSVTANTLAGDGSAGITVNGVALGTVAGRIPATPTTTVTGNLALWGGIDGKTLTDGGVALGVGGHAVPYMDGANTWTGVQTFIAYPIINGGLVNGVTFLGGAAGSPATVSAQGSDTNVGLVLTPKGQGAIMMTYPDSTIAGGTPRGAQATDLQISRYSANQVASGQNSTVVGGSSNAASGQTATVTGGYENVAAATGATATGGFSNTVDGQYARGGGLNSNSRRRFGADCWASGQFALRGDAETCTHVLRATSSSTSAVRLTADGAAAGSANCINVPDNTVVTGEAWIAGRDATTPAATGFFAIRFQLVRGSGAASTTVSVQNGGAIVGTTMSAPSLTADTTNGCLNATLTPPNGDTWRWAMRVQTIEVQ